MIEEKCYLILPGCDDTNRGDQALIWETVQCAKEAGFQGKYYMVADVEKSLQSKEEGIQNIGYLLPHPSTHFKRNNNIQYGKGLKIKWAAVSLIDATKAIVMLTKPGRFWAEKFGTVETKKSLQIYQNAEAAFVKGGGFLHAYGGITSTYSMFYDLYHVILALTMGIKVYVMPNSYGPFKGPGSGWLIKQVLKRCELVSARESISKDMLLQETGVSAGLYADLAFYLEKDKRLKDEQREKVEKIPFATEKCVALTMRPYRFPSSKDPVKEYQKYKQTMYEFVQWLDEKGYYPVIIEHTFSKSEHEQDMSCIRDVAELLGNSDRYMIFSDLSLNCRQLKYLYSRFEYIIGTRFHSVIFSIASGVPAIAITYGGNKGQGIMKDIGIQECAIEIENLEFTSLKSKFEYLEKNQSDIKNRIQDYLNGLLEQKNQLVESLRK